MRVALRGRQRPRSVSAEVRDHEQTPGHVVRGSRDEEYRQEVGPREPMFFQKQTPTPLALGSRIVAGLVEAGAGASPLFWVRILAWDEHDQRMPIAESVRTPQVPPGWPGVVLCAADGTANE